MTDSIEKRRSIRKFSSKKINKKIIEALLLSASSAPSAKNRQPWFFIVYQGSKKEKLVEVMQKGLEKEKENHLLMPSWASAISDAENTLRVMKEVSCLIAVINTNQKSPFSSIKNEERIVEICDSLSIGAAVENMILKAVDFNLGSLWIANTCFAYNDLVDFMKTDRQLTGLVALGYPLENPSKRPRKSLQEISDFNNFEDAED